MTAASESQLLALVHEQAEVGAKVANELELMNERLERLEAQGREQVALLTRLVAIQEARNEREAHAAELERLRTEASIEDRNARRLVLREFASKITVPLIGAVTALVTAFVTWLNGFWGHGDR